jgi:hypothetical protein
VKAHHQLEQLVAGQPVGVDGVQAIDSIPEISDKMFHRVLPQA